MRLESICFAAAAICTSGCATLYTPAPSERIAYVQGGFAQGGKVYPMSITNGALSELVKGCPAAEPEASAAGSEQRWGLGIMVASTAAEVPGLVLLESAAHNDGSPPSSGPTTAGLALMGVAVVGLVAGTVELINEQRHQLNAVNMFNDAIDAHRCGAGAAPPGQKN